MNKPEPGTLSATLFLPAAPCGDGIRGGSVAGDIGGTSCMSEWLKWSQIRLLVTLGISYILLAEVISLRMLASPLIVFGNPSVRCLSCRLTIGWRFITAPTLALTINE
jgi:hypothetical protein